MSDKNPKLSIADAEKVLEQAFPKQGVTNQIPTSASGAFKILSAKGEVLGSAFDLLRATRQAVQPVLKKEAARRLEEVEAQTQEFKDLISFLREKHADEFDKWRQARLDAAEAGSAAGDEPRPQPDPPRLVSV